MESWRCLGCGRCCYGFRINLRSFEYARITGFRSDAIELDSHGNPFLRKVDGRCIFLVDSRFCGLQPHGMKPLACKVWPFNVYMDKKPGGAGNSEFLYKSQEFYVYLHSEAYICPGINQGRPGELKRTISEVIETYMNPQRRQFYSTWRGR